MIPTPSPFTIITTTNTNTNTNSSSNSSSTPETISLRCLQCRDARIRCDKLRPACSACVKRNRDCWYVGYRPAPAPRARARKKLPQHTLQASAEATPVLRELCFVGERFGTLEVALLGTYMAETSAVLRSPLSFIMQALSPLPLQDGRTWATSITTPLAAAHATAWAAMCVAAVLRRNDIADVYLRSAIAAARLCYDVPCLETLIAMIAVTYAAFIAENFETFALFSGYVEILSAELRPHRVTDVQVRYISWLLFIATAGKKSIRTPEDRQINRAALTPAQALSCIFLESMNILCFQGRLTVDQAAMAEEKIRNLELSLAVALENRVNGDHCEIHVALTLLFLLCLRTGETHKLIPLTLQLVDIACSHPMNLHTRHWYFFSIGFSKYLVSCGMVEAATKMWSYLYRFRPLNVGLLGPLIDTDASWASGVGLEVVEVKDQTSSSYFKLSNS